MMLATWLVEFYLSKCNQLDDLVASESVSHDVENLQAERSLLEDELRQFFETYKVHRIYYSPTSHVVANDY
jgi:vacuolar protein sorting-associated protein 18